MDGRTNELSARLPGPLSLPLEQRARELESGRLSIEEWCGAANAWSRSAVARHRACVELQPVAPESGPVRVGVEDTARSAATLGPLHAASIVARMVAPEIESGCAGGAAAVAANICDVAAGIDTVGSVRLQAAACGIVGLRLTYDPARLEGASRVVSLLDAVGWMARTADDLAWFWRRWAGDAGHPDGALRIGVMEGAWEDGCLPQILSAMYRVCGSLELAGHELTCVRLDDLLRWRGAVYELRALEAGEAAGDGRRGEITAALHDCRRAVASRFEEMGVDLWLTPATSTIPHLGDPEVRRGAGYASLASFTGLPAITFPVAVEHERRVPISLQAIGRAGTEPRLICLAREVARLTAGLRAA